ncbi:MAG: hypothetical protein SH856_14080 [Flavobacteriales bacterium]|nr:hypothetical protein [Flavobacteriales bacterium]
MSVYSTYHLTEKDLNGDWLKSVKKLFRNKNLVINVQAEMDETEYLMSSEANAKILLERIESVKSGKGLIEVDIDKLRGELKDDKAQR